MQAIMNQFKLTGRVSWKDEYKVFESGNCMQKIQLGVKRGENWDNFFITFFNTQSKSLADIVCENVQKGEYIQVVGKIREEKFVPKGWENLKDEKGNQKTVSQINLIATNFKRVAWNEENEIFEIVDGENG